ncbi:hypothetical protein YC2023_069916 [Brassica napus]
MTKIKNSIRILASAKPNFSKRLPFIVLLLPPLFFDVSRKRGKSALIRYDGRAFSSGMGSGINKWNGKPYSPDSTSVAAERGFLIIFNDNQTLILVGETGSGKTTQVKIRSIKMSDGRSKWNRTTELQDSILDFHCFERHLSRINSFTLSLNKISSMTSSGSAGGEVASMSFFFSVMK